MFWRLDISMKRVAMALGLFLAGGEPSTASAVANPPASGEREQPWVAVSVAIAEDDEPWLEDELETRIETRLVEAGIPTSGDGPPAATLDVKLLERHEGQQGRAYAIGIVGSGPATDPYECPCSTPMLVDRIEEQAQGLVPSIAVQLAAQRSPAESTEVAPVAPVQASSATSEPPSSSGRRDARNSQPARRPRLDAAEGIGIGMMIAGMGLAAYGLTVLGLEYQDDDEASPRPDVIAALSATAIVGVGTAGVGGFLISVGRKYRKAAARVTFVGTPSSVALIFRGRF